MERTLSPASFVFAALLLTLCLLGVSVVAPQNDYYRWQEHNSGTTRKADWIYERLHFDPERIDVALIGTSRTGGGLSGPEIEAAYCKAAGRRIRVANLSLPVTGRNLHYLIAKEAMKTKAPTLTVVELNEVETRLPHYAFVELADAGDILSAPALINLNYFSDIARLPGRQALLWFKSMTGRAAVRQKFDPALYQGHDLDRTQVLPLLDGHVISRDVTIDEATLDAAEAAREDHASTTRLPHFLRPLEYRFSRVYLHKIETLAEKSGGDVAYVYLPAWRAPVMPDRIRTDLAIDRPVIDLGGDIANDPAKWFDATHVNAAGANEQTARFAAELVRLYPDLGDDGC
ncbi:MAG: hypothetical protein AAB227_00605 [Pseudomonadota bacterium]